jgi:hypothetical protein
MGLGLKVSGAMAARALRAASRVGRLSDLTARVGAAASAKEQIKAQRKLERAKRQAVSAQKMAGFLQGSTGIFIHPHGTGMKPGIYARFGIGRSYEIKAIFGFRKVSHIKPVLDFVPEESALVQREYGRIFGEELQRALSEKIAKSL